VVGMDWPVTIEGQAPTDAAQNPLTNLEAISPAYFDTMGIPLVEGRDIDDRDGDGRAAVAVVSQSFVKRFWPDGQAIGRRLRFPLPGSPYDRQWFTVVGIVGDAKYRELRGNRLDLYISSAQCPGPPVRRPDQRLPGLHRRIGAGGDSRNRFLAANGRRRRAE
jgi:putative ABC transport system permease protein